MSAALEARREMQAVGQRWYGASEEKEIAQQIDSNVAMAVIKMSSNAVIQVFVPY